jgi:hypothetical protein
MTRKASGQAAAKIEGGKTLQDLARDWEMRVGFSARALERACRGEPINRITAFQMAKELGQCSDEEAQAIADAQDSKR